MKIPFEAGRNLKAPGFYAGMTGDSSDISAQNTALFAGRLWSLASPAQQ